MKQTPIKITGQGKAFLVTEGNRALGTITQYKPGAVWVAYKGVGLTSRHAGNDKNRLRAMGLLK